MIETRACDPPHLVAEVVLRAVVAGGSVAVEAAIAIAIRLYVIGSTFLASRACF